MSRSLRDLTSLEGRVAVVTGGGAGTGAAIASRLAEGGATVVVADLDEAAAQRTAQALGGTSSACRVDIADEDSVAALLDAVRERHGRLDAWVNNAGVYPRDPLLEMPAQRWRQVLEVNLTGAFLCGQAAARFMVESGRGGVIVNIASLSAYRAPSQNMTHYVAAKAGVVGLTRGLAVELGPSGVRAVGVAPAFVLTDKAMELLRADGTPDAPAAIAARTPLRRVVEPDDVARVVYFAVCDLASMVSGSVVVVDGGQLAG